MSSPLAGQVLRCACPWCDRELTALPDGSGDRTRKVRPHLARVEDDEQCAGSRATVLIEDCWPQRADRPVGSLRYTQTGSMLRVVAPVVEASG